LKRLLDNADMPFFGGADKIVVCNVEFFAQLLKTDDGFVSLLLRGDPRFFSGALNLLAVFIRAGQEKM